MLYVFFLNILYGNLSHRYCKVMSEVLLERLVWGHGGEVWLASLAGRFGLGMAGRCSRVWRESVAGKLAPWLEDVAVKCGFRFVNSGCGLKAWCPP